jgi:hypothetical protein
MYMNGVGIGMEIIPQAISLIPKVLITALGGFSEVEAWRRVPMTAAWLIAEH